MRGGDSDLSRSDIEGFGCDGGVGVWPGPRVRGQNLCGGGFNGIRRSLESVGRTVAIGGPLHTYWGREVWNGRERAGCALRGPAELGDAFRRSCGAFLGCSRREALFEVVVTLRGSLLVDTFPLKEGVILGGGRCLERPIARGGASHAHPDLDATVRAVIDEVHGLAVVDGAPTVIRYNSHGWECMGCIGLLRLEETPLAMGAHARDAEFFSLECGENSLINLLPTASATVHVVDFVKMEKMLSVVHDSCCCFFLKNRFNFLRIYVTAGS